jgi:hypothetical protein
MNEYLETRGDRQPSWMSILKQIVLSRQPSWMNISRQLETAFVDEYLQKAFMDEYFETSGDSLRG